MIFQINENTIKRLIVITQKGFHREHIVKAEKKLKVFIQKNTHEKNN